MVIIAYNLLHRLVGQQLRNERQAAGQEGQEGYGMAGQQAHLFWQALA